jgi:hypothetical protein
MNKQHMLFADGTDDEDRMLVRRLKWDAREVGPENAETHPGKWLARPGKMACAAGKMTCATIRMQRTSLGK